ncbi:MAG: biotin--[acetyl-CoA-carboxylase] ligase, partial [Deltaproteobacteria bacterium]
MKARILTILRDNEDVVSGEDISTHLGISRVAVWKHIQKLQSLGYGIQSSAKGYQLQSS